MLVSELKWMSDQWLIIDAMVHSASVSAISLQFSATELPVDPIPIAVLNLPVDKMVMQI